MHIPSRVEVLSWNENQVADLLREHKLLDCVDCIYQRHVDGQKLLHLKEGDIMYFLEIHDQTSRGKFWNIVKQITEKQEKKGGVHSLMSKFQDTSSEWNNNAVEEDECSDESDDSFESDYDEPDAEVEDKNQTSISLERKETIRRNLLMSLMPQPAPPQVNSQEDYPESEDIYDVPEDGFGEPDEDMYDVPSDESGGGVVGRHPALERKESEQYLIPDDRNLVEISQTPDEEDYEDLNGAPPPMGRPDFDEQEDYVVPDTKPAAFVPARPPKPSNDTKPLPSSMKNGHREPQAGKKSTIKNLQAMFQEQENYEPPQPQRDLKKQKPPPSVHPPVSGPPKPPAKVPSKAPSQPPRIPKKIETKAPIPVEPEQEDEYDFPDLPPSTGKKPPAFKLPAFKPPQVQESPARQLIKKPPNNKKAPEPEQETYEPPEQPLRHPKKAAVKPPVPIEQENYEAPDTPARPTKKPQTAIPFQEDYEPPELQRKSKPVVLMDPEENYEDPNQISGGQADADEFEQEEYEIPDTSEIPSKEAPQETPKKSHFNLFNRSPSKKATPKVPLKMDKKKTIKNEVPAASLATPSPPVPENKQPPRQSPNPGGKSIFGKFRGEKADKRYSMGSLPSLPITTDKVDSKTKNPGSESPSLPPKPLPEKPAQKEKPVSNQRHKPEPPPSKPPHKTKVQLLQNQPWFHGSISKPVVADILKSTKKDGAYLVRNSSRDPGQCTMSILYKGEIRHLNIPCDANGHYRLGDSGVERFKSIEELVTYFIKHDVEFSAGGKTPLTHACRKSS